MHALETGYLLAGLVGGGIDNFYGVINLYNSTVSANSASNYGGGIYNEAEGTLNLDGSTVSTNTADSGGGIYNWHQSDTIVMNSRILNNTTATNGGGLCNADEGETAVTGSVIRGNTATSNGGGVYNDENTAEAISVTGSCITGNSAMSFFNNQTAGQIATGNWWGAPTGPNTPGADTTFGNVDVSGYLTAPILDCVTYLYLPLVVR